MAASLYALQAARGLISQAVGGSTLSEAKDRVLASTTLVQGPLVVWDGSPDGYGSIEAYMQCFADMAEWQGDGRFIFLPPLRRENQTAPDQAATAQIRTLMLAEYYPNHMIDAQVMLEDENGYVAAEYLQQPGGVHLNQTGMDLPTAALNDLLNQNYW